MGTAVRRAMRALDVLGFRRQPLGRNPYGCAYKKPQKNGFSASINLFRGVLHWGAPLRDFCKGKLNSYTTFNNP